MTRPTNALRPDSPDPDAWVTGVEAAEILGVHPATVSRWSSEKLMPSERKLIPVKRVGGTGGPKLFDRKDVMDLKRKIDRDRAGGGAGS